MEQNSQLLNAIYQNTKMGEESIGALIGSVKDPVMRQDLQTQKLGYHDFHTNAEQQLYSKGHEPKDKNVVSKVSTFAGIKMHTLTDDSPSNIAEMMIQGSTMGIIDMTKNLKRYSQTEQAVKDLASNVLTFEQNNIERMKSYL